MCRLLLWKFQKIGVCMYIRMHSVGQIYVAYNEILLNKHVFSDGK